LPSSPPIPSAPLSSSVDASNARGISRTAYVTVPQSVFSWTRKKRVATAAKRVCRARMSPRPTSVPTVTMRGSWCRAVFGLSDGGGQLPGRSDYAVSVLR
jgi:hypothetical protein